MAIAVASPHRAEAYEASRYVIEELKRRVPVWKREGYVDGETEWVPGFTPAVQEALVTPLVQLGPLAVAPSRPVPQSGDMADGFGRRIEYLRISVTDKCNLRCVYCMPEEGLPWLKREQILRYEEIAQIVRVMAGVGLRKIRLTGGEPLVRRDLSALVRMIRAVPRIQDVALSTNAVLLEEQAEELRDAGVDRVNVSLDSLRADRIDAISRRAGSAEAIFRGLDAAERVGFGPIKVNCVVMRGRNDDEVADFAAITRERPWHVRFIEVMPTGDNLGVQADEFVSADEMLERIRRHGRPAARGGAGRQRAGALLRVPRRAGDGGRHHAHEPQLLRALQPHAAHGGRPAAPLPVRPPADQPARPAAPWRAAGAAHPPHAVRKARAPLAGARHRRRLRRPARAVGGGGIAGRGSENAAAPPEVRRGRCVSSGLGPQHMPPPVHPCSLQHMRSSVSGYRHQHVLSPVVAPGAQLW